MDEFSPGLAALLGLLEGLTEYLPVSSTGHLILLGHLLGFNGEMAITVEICIQLGAVLAVAVYEREKIKTLLSQAYIQQRELFQPTSSYDSSSAPQSWTSRLQLSAKKHHHLWFIIGLAAAFLPAAFVGLLAHDWIEKHLFSPKVVAVSLIVGGIIIFIVETWPKVVRISTLENIPVRSAIGVGIAQCVALIPGMSRSGSTIVGGLLLGLDRKVATEFSFFLALPTMFAATGYKLLQSYHLFTLNDVFALLIGMVVSFIVAWVVIASFLTYVKRHTLKVFAYYRVALGLALLAVL
ncbi:MAG: undecaprenyl-diphosphate phosphatase [Nitrospirota bacterium]|nr:undecaprenyl-diphosphate phosphatase [Nitrospirota bacterium]